MKRPNTKAEILALTLESFKIRPITLWVKRPVSQADSEGAPAKPTTVEELIDAYPYHFPQSERDDMRHYSIGLGEKPVKKLKARLQKLGLTPDDWPALVPRKEFLIRLSKLSIFILPIREVFLQHPFYTTDYLPDFLGCAAEEVVNKTVGDILEINPLELPQDSNGERFFKKHRALFLLLRQRLIKKGFNPNSPFFQWDPDSSALAKARRILRNEKGLTQPEVLKFSRIAVARRWVR